jgi:toxin CptA
MPHGIGWLTVVGGILLGAGASVNGACVFGSVARLGSGQVAYLATPAGILAAALAMAAIERRVPGMSLAVRPAPEAGPAFAPAVPALVPLGLLLLLLGWRLAGLARTGHGRPWPDRIRRGLRSPHGATTMIGVCFALLLLFAGPWSYPEVLADLARERLTAGTAQGVALFLILLAGAFLAGRMPRHGFEWPGRGQPLRCFAGGFIMALGASLVPGSNDSLLLLGVPMLWPFAILALLAMGVTIAGLQLAGVRR